MQWDCCHFAHRVYAELLKTMWKYTLHISVLALWKKVFNVMSIYFDYESNLPCVTFLFTCVYINSQWSKYWEANSETDAYYSLERRHLMKTSCICNMTGFGKGHFTVINICFSKKKIKKQATTESGLAPDL